MNESTVLLTTPLVLQLPTENNELADLANCALSWEKDALLVTSKQQGQELKVPALQSKEWLQSCLQLSPVQKVYLDQSLGYSAITLWLDLCTTTKKQAYLGLERSQIQSASLSEVRRLTELATAGTLLLLLSPVILALAIGLWIESREPILLRQWSVGHRGRLFQSYQFRSTDTNGQRVTRSGYRLKKLRLDKLPQLVNVLQGKMRLIGPKPWALGDAIKAAPSLLNNSLNVFPGIVGTASTKKITHRDIDWATVGKQKFR